MLDGSVPGWLSSGGKALYSVGSGHMRLDVAVTVKQVLYGRVKVVVDRVVIAGLARQEFFTPGLEFAAAIDALSELDDKQLPQLTLGL